MLDTYKQAISNQFEAAFCMLTACVERCPDARWHAPVARLRFCQATFHVLIFTDLYLGPMEESLRSQAFHRDHASVFADYEEFKHCVPQMTYEKPFIRSYLQHCRDKASRVVAAETVATLSQRSAFPGKCFSRAEMHVNNIRHVHHHAAQLTLRLRLDTDVDVPWISSGWHSL